MHEHPKGERGFIALLAVMVVGIVLLGLSAQEGLAGWHARYNVLSAESKEQANALAEGCADQALAKLVAEPAFDYDDAIITTTEQGVCTVEIDTSIQGLASIRSQGEVDGAFANLQMTVNLNDVHIGDVSIVPTTGTLVVQAVVENDNYGSSELDDFTISVPGGTPSSFTGTATQAVSMTGNYGVGISGPTGYKTAFSGDCDEDGEGAIAIGEVKTCLITIDDEPTTITLVANVINDEGGSRDPEEFVLELDGEIVEQNIAISVSPGTHMAEGPGEDDSYTVSDWGYECEDDGEVHVAAGEQKTCVINYDDKLVAPSCADTVMMLDRTGSMTTTDRNNEKAAAHALLDLYEGIAPLPLPFASVGVFNARSGGGSTYLAEIIESLTDDFDDLHTAVDLGLASSGGGTNLVDAITKAQNELVTNGTEQPNGDDSARVIILVSDGMPTHPSNSQSAVTTAANNAKNAGTEIFTIHFGNAGSNEANRIFMASLAGTAGEISTYNQHTTATDYRTPAANHLPNGWTNSSSGWQNDDSFTTSGTGGAEQGYSNFNFQSFVPSGSTINGIEVTVGGKSTAPGNPIIPADESNFTLTIGNDISGWDETGAETGSVTLAVDPGAGNDSASPAGGKFAKLGSTGAVTPATQEWVCHRVDASAYASVSLSYYWRGDNDGEAGQDRIRVEHMSGGATCSAAGVWTEVASHALDDNDADDGTGTPPNWSALEVVNLPANLNGWVRFRNDSDEAQEHARIDLAQVTGSAGSGNCSINIAVSGNNGGSFSATKSLTLTPTEPAAPGATLGSASDKWGLSWNTGNIDNDFVVRIGNTNCTGTNTASVDYVTAKVHYTGYDPIAENADGDYFFIAPQSSDMEEVFTTIGELACPATDPDATAAPTDATLTVVTHVINDNTGNLEAEDFEMTVDHGGTTYTFDGEESPGVVKSIQPGSYSVTGTSDDGYYKTLGVNCSSSVVGNISAGGNRTCTVTYDDKPAPPPPPNLNINLGSWGEVPDP